MKIAVVTPYYKEPINVLKRCHRSVLTQTYKDITHIMVADGNPEPWVSKQKIEHIILPASHNDAGATPRALGAMSAFSRGYDAIAFLDADNWYEPLHIQLMVEAMAEYNVDAVIATRTIHHVNGNSMYVDTIESTGRTFVDTNCWFMHKKTAKLMAFWITDPSQHLISDKIFFQAIKQSGISIAKIEQPTVAYVTKWGWHYERAGLPIPSESIWMAQDQHGNYITIKEKNKGVVK
jgi:cellulose synthase/poly-beta-1,6-N-acetylglucosamine synthase-like glycosyltransferase